MKRTVYFDHAATTPLHPKALEAMLPYLSDRFGNPSGAYALGRQAARAVDEARRTVAEVLGCRPREVVFTGAGTESINLAIKGTAFAQKLAGLGNHIVTSTTEHHAVLHSCEYLERFGFETTYVPVDRFGMVSPQAVADALTDRTVLVSVMLANNEVGTINPVAEVAAAVRERGKQLRRRIPFHTDAVQAANSLELSVQALGVDLLSLSSHKFYGPKGTGVLYLRGGTPLLALQSGGGQERQRRAGTENVAAIVGTAVALRLAQESRAEHSTLSRRLRDRIVEGVRAAVPAATLNGHPERRLPNNAHFSFEGAESDDMLAALDKRGVAASAGSACTSATWEPSHVLAAMGVPLARAVAALRLTVGPDNTDDEVDYLLSLLPQVVAESRAKSRGGASPK
ncbi:MAG: cysteine desulfurase [Dehalococcoidia bacterium]|nr:MAG: cysteine desulfurase [Dehalococcoidia bacterium]